MRWRAVRKGGNITGGAGSVYPPVSGSSSTTYAFTCNITAASLTESVVQAAIDSATDGQTVCLPAGTAAWTTQINLPQDRSVTLAGAGTVPLVGAATSGGTTITVNSTNSFIAMWEIQTSISNPTVANITFEITQFGPRPGPPGALIYIGSRGGTNSIPVSYNDKMGIVHHITVNQHDGVSGDSCAPSLCSVEWASFVPLRGVVYRNKITNEERWTLGGLLPANAHIECKGSGGSFNWASASYFGMADTDGNRNLYIEDNTFTNGGGVLDLDDGCKSNVRYNTFTDSVISDHGHDTSTIGVRTTEVHDNTFRCAATTAYDFAGASGWYASRGGTYVITDNIAPQTCYSVTRTPWAALVLSLYRDDLVNAAQPTGDVISGSAIVSGLSSTAGILVGQKVVNANIYCPDTDHCTKVLSIDSSSQITLDTVAIGSASGTTIRFLDCYPGPYPWLRQTGWGWAGSGDETNEILEPAYIWNNKFTTGGTVGEADLFNPYDVSRACHFDNSSQTSAGYIQEGREYYLSTTVGGGSGKPGYTKYTYPHPLATFIGNP